LAYLLELAGEEIAAVLLDDPRIDRPRIVKRRHQSARVDQRVALAAGRADRRPVAMRQIDMAEGGGARHEGHVRRIELPLHPVWPDPVEIVLDGLRVDDAARVEDEARAEELDRLGGLGRTAKAAQPPQRLRGVGEAVGPGGPARDVFPWDPLYHDGCKLPHP